MEKRVYKYPLEVQDRQAVEMPKGTKVLSVQAQWGVPCLWALVDPAQEKEKVIVRTVGTGQPIYDSGRNLEYVGTYKMLDDQAVFHVFIEKEL